jgi:hypothetical protein
VEGLLRAFFRFSHSKCFVLYDSPSSPPLLLPLPLTRHVDFPPSIALHLPCSVATTAFLSLFSRFASTSSLLASFSAGSACLLLLGCYCRICRSAVRLPSPLLSFPPPPPHTCSLVPLPSFRSHDPLAHCITPLIALSPLSIVLAPPTPSAPPPQPPRPPPDETPSHHRLDRSTTRRNARGMCVL